MISRSEEFNSLASLIKSKISIPGIIKIDWANNMTIKATKISHPDLTCPELFLNNEPTLYFNYLSGYSNITSSVSDNPNIVAVRSEEHTSELQSRGHLVCRLLFEIKKTHHEAD